MVVFNRDAAPTPCEPGVTRKILCHNDNLMMCEITFLKGACGNAHKHPHEQITYVGAGSFCFTVGDEVKTVSKGDGVYIPPDTIHGVEALEDGLLVDVFSPERKEFLK